MIVSLRWAIQCQPYSSIFDPLRCAFLLTWREWKWIQLLSNIPLRSLQQELLWFAVCFNLMTYVLRGWIPLGPGTQFSSESYRSSVSSILSENRRLIICTFVRLRAVIKKKKKSEYANFNSIYWTTLCGELQIVAQCCFNQLIETVGRWLVSWGQNLRWYIQYMNG